VRELQHELLLRGHARTTRVAGRGHHVGMMDEPEVLGEPRSGLVYRNVTSGVADQHLEKPKPHNALAGKLQTLPASRCSNCYTSSHHAASRWSDPSDSFTRAVSPQVVERRSVRNHARRRLAPAREARVRSEAGISQPTRERSEYL
jgi:hypothetical protein